MNRSDFLKRLIASVSIGRLPVSVTRQFRKIYLLQSFIAGFRYYEGMQLLNRMKEGDLLALVREPDNRHDECAIALHWQGTKVGYIPAAINEILSYLLDAEALSLFAVITHLEKDVQPWENAAVAVYFIQEVNKDLPAHAGHLTRIEAPHYRTLHKNKKQEQPQLDTGNGKLFDDTDRVINLDTIPTHRQDAKAYFEKFYGKYPIPMKNPGRYLHVKDDGIYTYMYEIDDDVGELTDKNGKKWLEFFLV